MAVNGAFRDALAPSEARRIALAAQGFDRPRPTGRVDARRVCSTIRRLGLLQIDFVNVLVPAHYQVLFSRLGAYDPGLLDDLVYRRREFVEHWAHERSIVPVESWPLLHHRRAAHRVRPWGFESFLERSAEYVQGVLEEVRARGPLTADDLPEPETTSRRAGEWNVSRDPRRMADRWGWGLAVRTQVLEAHFGFGRLAVAGRLPNFARASDLAELVEEGELRQVRVDGWREPAYLHPEARLPRRIEASALLSPFDPLVWTRPRAARLFGFDYRLEIFVPGRRRRWGYYVLPFLLGDRLVARVDLRADRAAHRLHVLAAYLEPAADPAAVAPALTAELRAIADWLGLESVFVGRRGGFARSLRAAVRRPQGVHRDTTHAGSHRARTSPSVRGRRRPRKPAARGTLGALVVSLALGACGGPGAGPSRDSRSGAAQEAGAPLDPRTVAACDSLATLVGEAVRVPLERRDGGYEDHFSGTRRSGCRISASGHWSSAAPPSSPVEELRAALLARGWSEEVHYAADGPNGSLAGLRRGDLLCVAGVTWVDGHVDPEEAGPPPARVPYEFHLECFREP